jgi:FkbM family methyltransferase
MMDTEMTHPPAWLRLAGSALRRIPRFRGRARFVELPLHRYATNRGWGAAVEVNGYALAVSLDDLIGRSIYLEGSWEHENTAAVRRLLRPGDGVLDVGANIGYFSLLFSRLVGPAGRVRAFEPVPGTAALLRQNLARNPALAARVQVYEVALSDREGEVRMAVSGGPNRGASHVVAAPIDSPGRAAAGVVETRVIRSRTADSVWEEEGRPRVDLVKLDIEGHELHALKGMGAILDASPDVRVLVEVHDPFLRAAGGSAAELYALMASHGLAAYEFAPGAGAFRRFDEVREGSLVVFSRRAP